MAVRVIRKCVELTVMVWLMTNIAARSVHAQDQVPCDSAIGIIESLQGIVEVRRQNDRLWRAAKLGERVCPDDAIRVGEYGRAALALAETNEVLRLDQNTTIRLPAAAGQERPLLDLVMGVVQFFSNHPRSLNVRTPFLNAGVEGTEFLVRVTSDETFLIVFNGRVRAENQLGAIVVSGDQAVTARASAAPVPQVPVRPRDAVRWAIHYPPVLDDLAPGAARRGASDLPEAVRAAIELYRQNRIAEAIARLTVTPGAPVDPRVLVYRAGLLLQVGRLDEANADLTRVLTTNPDRSDALALRAVTAVVSNDRDRALADANRAVTLDPGSDAARIAQSYALQASFRLEEARVAVSEALERNPDNALAWARLAELWLSLGYRQRALEAAHRAEEIAPDLARTQLVLGFAQLAEMDTAAAETTFRRAIESDTTDPQSRLGLGLARIRRNDLAGGREQLEIAAGIDPGNSLVRSYLGKAYDEERRSQIAGEQFSIAETLDPLDPTPLFYDALRKQAENRPVEALDDLERAIDLNGNRAVYRSSLLLDEDLAVRQISLGRIYNDLGFEQRAVSEAAKSLSLDPANYSAHRFLSDIYAERPRHEIARVSELLQSQLLQPLSANPIQPRLSIADINIASGLGPADVTFSEFNPLFARDGFRITGSTVFGNYGTFGEEVAASALIGRLALTAGQFHSESDGYRPNSGFEHDIYNIFAQAALTDQFSIQAEYRKRDTQQGDLSQDFEPLNAERNAFYFVEQEIFLLGGRYSPSPDIDVIASIIHSDRSSGIGDTTTQRASNGQLLSFKTDNLADLDGLDAATQLLFRRKNFNLVVGAGSARIDIKTLRRFKFLNDESPAIPTPSKGRVEHRNGYAYANFTLPQQTILTLGLSYDHIDDSYVRYQDTEVNPKIGLQWSVYDWLRIRAAIFRAVKRPLIVDQTIEPTQIAGFNQLYDYENGSRATQKSFGVDVNVTKELLVGVEYSDRDVDVPTRQASGPPSSRNQDEASLRSFVYWTPHQNWALSAEAFRETIEAPGLSFREVKTLEFPLTASYYHQSGFFAQLGATFVRQSVDPAPVGTSTTRDEFSVIDAAIGYRLPDRRGIISLEVRNLLGEEFLYTDYDYINNVPATTGSRFIPDRSILGRITISF